MILFKPEHVEPILAGRKTQTRRLGDKRWNVGMFHQARTTMFGGEPFAYLRIVAVRRERLLYISEDDARAEGYSSPAEYLAAFKRIFKIDVIPASTLVWVVCFELVKEEVRLDRPTAKATPLTVRGDD